MLRGEVVWWKGRAAGGSCAWGTFQRPSNPVLRDVTERIVIASKGRFDRALKPIERQKNALPSVSTISRDEFLEATTDLWEIPPESANRVGHPAPFPVALPVRLIELYTYEDDVVLDPFMGSGSTAVAAVRTNRRYLGFETDKTYIARARNRIKDEAGLGATTGKSSQAPFRVSLPASAKNVTRETAGERAVRDGKQAKELACMILEECGFSDIESDVGFPALGIDVNFVAVDGSGGKWAFDVAGAFTATRAGLKKSDTLWKALAKAAVLDQSDRELCFVVMTTDAPAKNTSGGAALAAVTGPDRPIYDVVELLNPKDLGRLKSYAKAGRPTR